LLAFSGSCLVEIGRDMTRGEALLLEAQSLAARVGLEHGDIYGGLGCVALHKGDYDAARGFLQQAWKLVQTEQDHWRECNGLTYLIMTELEAGDAIAALTYGQEMTHMAAQIEGKESESAIAHALTALAHYQLHQPEAEDQLNAAILKLQQLDIKRIFAYILIGAAAVDLEDERWEFARRRFEAALQAAQLMNHPSQMALAEAGLIQSHLGVGNLEQAIAQWEILQQQDRHWLSARAQTQIDRVMQQLTPISTRR
jgi:tetratricopeptide (TPR) repeat protein